jgi:Ca-activated chloride channel family protein
MNREQAEKLLAALIFDDLDEPSRAELMAYLQTDDDLRERLADMRMAVKLAGDAVNEGPEPVLSERRLKELKKLAASKRSGTRVFSTRYFGALAAVVMVGIVFAGLMMPSLSRVRCQSKLAARADRQIGFSGGTSVSVPLDSESADLPLFQDEASSVERFGLAASDKTDNSPEAGMGGMGGYGGGMMGGMSSLRLSRHALSESAPRSSSLEEVVAGDQRVVDGYMADSEAKRQRADVGSISYEWSGTLISGKPVVATRGAVPAGSPEALAEQSAATPHIVNGPAEAVTRAPALGDVPLAGRLLQLSESDAPARVAGDRMELLKRKDAMDPKTSDLSSGSRFAVVPVNPWVMTDRDPLSTFGLDVDTASYALCRRYIRGGFLPPVGAVRMEEFINAFDYAYPQQDGATFAVHAEGAPSPFAPAGRDLTLLKIAVKARTVGRDQRRAAHIVFVVDASASMGQADRLPQVQAAMSLLVDKLSDADRVSLVTCANEARLHLEAVSAKEKDTIRRTIDAIQPAGPTNLLEGLRVGYAMARRAFVAGQINQVVLCSDGVANVGATEAKDVLDKVDGDRRQGITLTCVGVGYGAYNDAFLESLADHGDGRYVFLDSSEQAREDLVGQLAATLQTVARDARIQVQFNPACVRRYRLIGYENRDIEDRRFRDDTVDAGEVGSGQCSTALYELELVSPSGQEAGDLGTVFVRYRNADTGQIEETSRALAGSIVRRLTIEENPRFFLAAAVARFAEWLRQSEHAKDTRLTDVQDVLDRVSAVLPLDQTVRDVATLAHQAENLPRATETTAQP